MSVTSNAEGGSVQGIEIRELECFLLVAEELHFGRVAMRLGLPVNRTRELVERLEHRIGTPLLDNSAERLRLSPFGEEFLSSLRPAYGALVSVLEDARDRASSGQRMVRLGFPGQMREPVDRAVKVFEKRSPEARVEVVENPLEDPFGPLRDGRVDAAVVLLPVRERDLVIGPVFDRQPQRLAVSAEHPLADRDSVGVEDMAQVPLIPVRRSRDHWLRVHAPTLTPLGKRIHHHEGAEDLQDGLRQVALKRGAMLLCGSVDGYEETDEIALVPVVGLPESSFGLVWPRGGRNPGVPALAAAFFEVLV
ncbi:LysR family transcriptional regulator [Nocardiopsis xinjiangensis]|uniref:LysR family transcriptional regulator n=1 Tax=Nocardiopsis xinjiangensis TaxID=124285 RepID=UPI00035EDFF7|nr:LysR family transcriptional regulator [Nocardiopsis xinjiangensis]